MLGAATKETKQFSNPWALSSALAVLGTLQPQAFRLLNCSVPLVLVYNVETTRQYLKGIFMLPFSGFLLQTNFT